MNTEVSLQPREETSLHEQGALVGVTAQGGEGGGHRQCSWLLARLVQGVETLGNYLEKQMMGVGAGAS